MTRSFSIPTVLRMVPNRLLQEFFVKLGHADFDPHWRELREREIDPILDYLSELPRGRMDEFESGLRNVSDLASESGFNAMLEAGPLCGVTSLGSLVPEDLGPWGRAMWVWLHHRAVFEKALMIDRVEHMPSWRKRNDVPRIDPDTSPDAIAKLERDISTLLQSQGRGRDCTVEVMQRGGVTYVLAHPDDCLRNFLAHDEDGKLSPASFRQTLHVVFAYDREEGSLETFAKFTKPIKEQLEVIFADAILHWELGKYDPEAAYELDQLKDPSFDLTPDPGDQLRISIRKMRLSATNSGRRLLVEVGDDPRDDIHRAIEECINLEGVPLSEWHVTQVTFCFEFLPLDGRVPGRLSFDVGFPRSCNLRNARPERVELIQKYLKRWRIDRAATAESRVVAVGP